MNKSHNANNVWTSRLQAGPIGGILLFCWNRDIEWAGNQALWGHRKTRHGGTGSAWEKYMGRSPRMESFSPWCLFSGEFLHFYQRLMWPAHVCTVHQCMPAHQAAGSGSVSPPQFSPISVFVGLGSALLWGTHGLVEVLTWETHEWRMQKAFSCFLFPPTYHTCYYNFLTKTAVGSVHLFHKNKSGSGQTPNCIPLQDPRTEIGSCHWVGIQIPILYTNS